jgi:hypothetical protein
LSSVVQGLHVDRAIDVSSIQGHGLKGSQWAILGCFTSNTGRKRDGSQLGPSSAPTGKLPAMNGEPVRICWEALRLMLVCKNSRATLFWFRISKELGAQIEVSVTNENLFVAASCFSSLPAFAQLAATAPAATVGEMVQAPYAVGTALCGTLAGYAHSAMARSIQRNDCCRYLPVSVTHSAPTASGYVQYAASARDQLQCGSGRRLRRLPEQADLALNASVLSAVSRHLGQSWRSNPSTSSGLG